MGQLFPYEKRATENEGQWREIKVGRKCSSRKRGRKNVEKKEEKRGKLRGNEVTTIRRNNYL